MKLVRIFTALCLMWFGGLSLKAETSVGDITKLEGMDENYLTGWGIVVGVNGKGDKGLAVKQLARQLYKSMGKDFNEKDLEARNMAIVYLTARLPALTHVGQKIDVTVLATGAESIEGGTLLAAPMYISGQDLSKEGPYSQAVVLAQGAVMVGNTGTVGKDNAGSNAASASNPTSGTIQGGGLVLSEIPHDYVTEIRNEAGQLVGQYIDLILDRKSFTNAQTIADSINNEFEHEFQQINPDGTLKADTQYAVNFAEAENANLVRVRIPEKYWGNEIEFISKVELTRLSHIESEALVVLNEKTGSITISGEIKLNACTVSYNEITINITKDQDLEQVLQQLSQTLTTKDLIAIIRQINEAGHLRAKVKVS